MWEDPPLLVEVPGLVQEAVHGSGGVLRPIRIIMASGMQIVINTVRMTSWNTPWFQERFHIRR